MPVDAEAYMAGAIPPLSRGGSWLPNQGSSNGHSLPPLGYQSAYGSSPVSAFPQTPPGPIGGSPLLAGHPQIQFPRSPWTTSSPSPSPGPGSVYSARSRTMSQNDLAGSASIHGLKRENVLGPVKHNGWLKTPSESSNSVSGSLYQKPMELPPASNRSVHPNHLRTPVSGFGSGEPKDILQKNGSTWGDQAGSSRSVIQADHNHDTRSLIHREVSVPISSPYRKLLTQNVDQPSPYRRVAELLPTPPAEHERPALSRRHSHNPLHAPKPRKSNQEDLFRSAQLNNRLARLSIQGGDASASKPQSAPNSPASMTGGDTHGSRPSMSRRHSSSDRSSSSSYSGGSAQPRPDHVHRSRHLSTPHSSPLVPQPSPASSHSLTSARSAVHSRTLGPRTITSTPSSLTTPNQPSPQSFISPGGTYRSAPNAPIAATRSRTSSVVGEPMKNPAGYISPLDDDSSYDPYEAHPAPSHHNDITQSRNGSSIGGGDGGGSVIPTMNAAPGQQKEYVPPGFAQPTRNLAWNREGPSMKTHGIAWNREGDPQALPTAPKGPRWIVARPPRTENVQNGGSWWETGGGGTSYNPQF